MLRLISARRIGSKILLTPRPNFFSWLAQPVPNTASKTTTPRMERLFAINRFSSWRQSIAGRELVKSDFASLPLVFALAQPFEHGESGLLSVGDRERLELLRRTEVGKHLAHRLLAGWA